MAKKKVSKQQEKAQPASPPQEHLSEQMVNLKALNNLLVRQTVDHRDQIDMLRRSNHSLQSKISQNLSTNQFLETQKSQFEDRLLAAEIERDVSLLVAAFSLQFRQNEIKCEMTQRLESAEKEKEVLIAQIAVLEEIELKAMQEETDRLVREMGRTQSDLEVKRDEVNGLKSAVNELQVSYEEAREEMGSLQMECDRAKKEKLEVEERLGSLSEDRDSIQEALQGLMERYEDLKREMGDAVRKRNEIEKARNEMGVKIIHLQEEVGLLAAEISSNRGALDRVLLERDALQNDLDLQKTEEKRNLESLMEERASLERRLMESALVIEDLNRKMEDMLRDQNNMECTMAHQEVVISDLQSEVSQCSATIPTLRESCWGLEENNHRLVNDLSHQKDLLDLACSERNVALEHIAQLKEDGTGLRTKVFEMEVKGRKVQEEVKQVLEELDGLREERKERERSINSLTEENKELTRNVGDLMAKMREIVAEKEEIEQVRIEQEDQIKQLRKEVGCLSTKLSALQESCRECKERNSQLQADMNEILCEKAVVGTSLARQRQETEVLRLKLREMEKSHEEKQKELLRLKIEKDNLVEKVEERERCFELLIKAKDLIQGSLDESQRGLKDLQVKAELAEMISQRTLSMLKHAAETMNGLKDEEKGSKGVTDIDEEQINDEIQPFVTHLKAIKKAFRSQVQEVDEMNQELKSMQISVAKSKYWSFWKWLSSATTIVAAISIAYFTKGH